ncbi:MAG: threonine synthase [Anaerolineae bacterium]|nr:threonine synthase [Anaerolineae bacterium]
MKGILETFRDYLPVTPNTPRLSLGEGDTPLVRAPAISRIVDADVWLKLEGCNPTGSFKDRGMVVAIAKAVEEGARAVICASTGNTAASAAAYAARAGLVCAVVIPAGKIALGKLSQALMHRARVLPIEGNFDAALRLVRDLAEQGTITLVNSINPYRIEGQKTAAFEIVDALGDAPDILALPVGNAGNITAYWRGFTEYHRAGKSKLPKMFGFQAAGAAPIVRGAPIENPQTIATAIRIGNPASWRGAMRARDESGGLIEAVTDEEILAAYHFLAEREGVFCEPASAAGVAGIFKLARESRLPRATRIVCVLTGSGLKDPDTAIAQAELPPAIPATMDALARILDL